MSSLTEKIVQDMLKTEGRSEKQSSCKKIVTTENNSYEDQHE